MTPKRKLTAVALGFAAFELAVLVLIVLWIGLVPGLVIGLCWPSLIALDRSTQDIINRGILRRALASSNRKDA